MTKPPFLIPVFDDRQLIIVINDNSTSSINDTNTITYYNVI